MWAYDVVNEAICDFGYLCYPDNNCSKTVNEKWNNMGRVTDRGVWEVGRALSAACTYGTMSLRNSNNVFV